MPLTVVTWNLHWGEGTDGNFDIERIARVLDPIGADFIGFQEVDKFRDTRSNFADMPEWLADRLGMYPVYGPNLDNDPLTSGAPRRRYGNLILSAHPVAWWENTLLPKPGGGEQRGMLQCIAVAEKKAFRLISTHFQHDVQPEDIQDRVAQSEAVTTVVTNSQEHYILFGDLNATPASTDIDDLLGVAGQNSAGGSTFTFPSGTPTSKIDYILTDLPIASSSVVTTDNTASDHRPIQATLTI